jgi:hypothetical protein
VDIYKARKGIPEKNWVIVAIQKLEFYKLIRLSRWPLLAK